MTKSILRQATALLVALLTIISGASLPSSLKTRSFIVHAQDRNTGVTTYAITNARIVTVSGATIERATIVIRDGLIASVSASAPPDARVIDAAGQTVYPGLFDAYTALGVPASQPQQARPGGGTTFVLTPQNQPPPPYTAPNSTQPPGLQPEVLAADIIQSGGEQIEAARNVGITTALTIPREGIFTGQSALINLSGANAQQMIVRSPVALHVGFTPLRGGTYPGSLMGVFAALRQAFLDAGRYREQQQLYTRSPRGLRRPDQDRSLAALLPALARAMPVVMLADREREINRALDLAEEFNLRLIIAGGNEAWKVAERLKRTNTPVLLSLNFPRRTTAPAPDADPEPLRILRDRVEIPKNAGRLAAAGVRFAFQSGGMQNINDYLTNAGRAIENGLSRDDALRAMTVRPAEMFGVADRLGSIEVGKIANLVVARGDLFGRDRQITNVFIDGRPIDLRPATTPTASGGATASSATTASGVWTLRVPTNEGQEQSVTLNLRQEANRLTGSISGDLGSADIANGSISPSGELRFTAPVQLNQEKNEATFTGTIAGNEMRGTVTFVGRQPANFIGTRGGGGATTPPNQLRLSR